MNGDTGFSALFYLLLLVFPLSALLARRLPIGSTLKMAAGWLAIFLTALVAVTAIQRSGWRLSDLQGALGLSNQIVSGGTVSIPRDVDGHFRTTVSINGHRQVMMIDTGATYTSVTPATAAAAGVTVDSGFGQMIETANGTVLAQRATAATVNVGPITARNLELSVAPSFGEGVIGMNFLSALDSWRVERNRMILVPRKREP